MELKKASPFGRGGGEADGEGKNQPSHPLPRELSQRESLGLSPAVHVRITSNLLCREKSYFLGRGTCGAAWNSLFVLRKLSSSHHDFLMPWKSYIVEPIGWWHLAARGSYSAVCRRDFPMQGDVTLKLGTVAKLL